mgnify:FL=1|tara:strand:- start:55 stop:249 length:195 start_codon:yes stop_codon:yes gene_type:complete
MAWKFNPITGQINEVGGGGGALDLQSVLDALGVQSFSHRNYAIGAGINTGEIFYHTGTGRLTVV